MKDMKDVKAQIGKAREAVREVLNEFVPARDHAVGAGKELLLAMREVIDAQVRLIEKSQAKGSKKACCPPPAAKKQGANRKS